MDYNCKPCKFAFTSISAQLAQIFEVLQSPVQRCHLIIDVAWVVMHCHLIDVGIHMLSFDHCYIMLIVRTVRTVLQSPV